MSMSSEGMSGSMLEELRGLIISGDGDGAKALVSSQLDRIDPVAMIEDGMAPAMAVVGDRFGRGEIYLPEMIKAANAFEDVMTVLRPKILESGQRIKRIGAVVIGSVQTDIHEIGKNIVANMLSTGGFEVHDLGADVSPLVFIDKAEEVGADIIAASAIMTTTMPYQKDIIDVLESMGLRDRFKVIVGGGPVNQEWAREIGADGYADTAPEAVELAKELMSGKS
jgi:corrinoid protein of di/trimethylamine methyltransferase